MIFDFEDGDFINKLSDDMGIDFDDHSNYNDLINKTIDCVLKMRYAFINYFYICLVEHRYI